MMELSGMLGDLGTLLPLLLACANVGAVRPAAALLWMGTFNFASAVAWDLPMPVQPMKTVAAAAIVEGLSAREVQAAGIFAGGVTWLLGATRGIDVLHRLVPRPVVSGIQVCTSKICAGVAACALMLSRERSWGVGGKRYE